MQNDPWGVGAPEQDPAPSLFERLGDFGQTIGQAIGSGVTGFFSGGGIVPYIVAGALLVGLLVVGGRSAYKNSPRRDPDRVLVGRSVARWMVRRTLHRRRVRVPFLVPWPFFGRLVYGVHVLIVATTGYGKSVLIKWALAYHLRHWSAGRHTRHLVLYDPKGEFFETFRGLYAAFGWRYYVYTMLPEHPASASINVVATPAMARVAAGAMWSEQAGVEGHFAGKARQVFLAAVDATGYRGLVAAWELLRDPERLEAACYHHAGLARAYSSIRGENERSGIMSTVARALSLLDDPDVSRVFEPDGQTEQPDFSSWQTPCSAHVCADWQTGQELAPLTSALQEVLYFLALSAGKKAAGDARGPGTYCYLDEATSGGLRARKVMSYLAAGRGDRTYTAVVAQDVPQVEGRLGRSDARSTMSNAPIKIFGQSDDPDTQEYAANMSGMTRIRWEPPRAMPGPFSGGQQPQPRRIETIRRTNMLADHFGELGWGEFFCRSRTPGRARVIVRMPDIEPHLGRLIPEHGRGWDMHGVSNAQVVALAERLLAGDVEARTNPHVPAWLHRAVQKHARRRALGEAPRTHDEHRDERLRGSRESEPRTDPNDDEDIIA